MNKLISLFLIMLIITGCSPQSFVAKSSSTETELLSDSYIISDSDKKVIDREELDVLTDKELSLALNEIYARHGKIFDVTTLNDYFTKQVWYSENASYSDQLLNNIEKDNIALIASYLSGQTASGAQSLNTQSASTLAEAPQTSHLETTSSLANIATIPHIASIKASSEMIEKDSKGNVYPHTADNMIDGDLDTVWTDDEPGLQTGQEITITLDELSYLKGIVIYNGHQKSTKLFNQNDRVADITIYFSDGSYEFLTLQDTMGPVSYDFSKEYVSSDLTITIDTLYSGSKYHDVCITELLVY